MRDISPKSSRLNKVTVEAVAERVAKALDFQPGSSLYSLVHNLGGEVNVVDFWDPEKQHGSLVVEPNGDFEINIPDHTSLKRDNFTIAHELGHYFLHYVRVSDSFGPDERLVATRFGSERVEWEANWFAATFLMPKKQFVKTYKKNGGDLAMVAEKFAVSRRAAELRAERLGLE